MRRPRLTRALAFLAALAAPVQAQAAAAPIIIQKNGPTVLFQASTTMETRDRLLALLDDGVTTLIVNGGGGDPLPAIDIGREIHRRGLTVVVLGVCASGCAHFLFVPARRRVVQPESLVVFHNTSSSMLKMIGDAPVPAALRDRLSAAAKAEKAFYAEIGAPESLLLEPQAKIQTLCYRIKDPPAGNNDDLLYFSRFNGWTPTAAYLAADSLPVEGFWPATSSMEEALRAHHKLFLPTFKWLALGPDKPATPEALDAAYREFGHLCTDSDLKAP